MRQKIRNNLLPRRKQTLSFRGRFSPLDIADATLWFDADDTSTLTIQDTNKVAGWKSKGSNDANAANTGDSRPDFGRNVFRSRDVIDFSGSARFLEFPTVTISSQFDIFIVTKTTLNSTQMILGNSATTQKIGGLVTNRKLAIRIISTLDNAIDFPLADNSWGILEINRDSANKVDFNFNFQSTPTRLFSDAAQSGNYALNRIARDDVTSHYRGDIAEIIIYSRKITDQERANLREYVLQKYFGVVERNADGSPKLAANNDIITV
jgi:hypothetical protein